MAGRHDDLDAPTTPLRLTVTDLDEDEKQFPEQFMVGIVAEDGHGTTAPAKSPQRARPTCASRYCTSTWAGMWILVAFAFLSLILLIVVAAGGDFLTGIGGLVLTLLVAGIGCGFVVKSNLEVSALKIALSDMSGGASATEEFQGTRVTAQSTTT